MAALQPLRNRIFFSFGAHRAWGCGQNSCRNSCSSAELRQPSAEVFSRVRRGASSAAGWRKPETAHEKPREYEKRLLTKFAYKETQSFAKIRG